MLGSLPGAFLECFVLLEAGERGEIPWVHTMFSTDSPRSLQLPSPLRTERIAGITSEPSDLLVVGGGIHGACIAKLAARAGLRVGLLEMGDYASATSSRSSKMAHGGLRYLEMFDFQQVFEGIKSREELFERCPNLVTPHPFLIPVPRDGYVLRYKLALGLFLYDLLVKNPARRHAWIPKAQLNFSGFNSTRDDLMGCFRYTDGLMNDSRLVIEMIVSAERHGAQCLNYARVEHIRKEQDGLMTVVWRDLLTDQEHISRAKIVVNCAGPWAPQLREANDIHQALEVRYSRGTHLLFSTPWRDPALFLPLPEKGRYYFVWPHPTGTMVGTTEREVDELALDPQPSADEVEEVLGRLKKDLPHSGLSRETLHYAFAGIRTLPMRSARKGVSRLSRKHVWRFSHGVLTLLGGKYTTFAWTAAEGLSRVLHELGRGKQTVDALDDLPSVTDSRSSEQLLNQLRDQYGYEGPGVERAVKRLGRMVLRYTEKSEAWTELTGGVLRVELLNAVELEHAETVEDVLRRRLDLEYTPSHGLECLGVVADALAERRGREVVEREQREIVERLRVLHRLLGIPEIKA
jgi:glycerol-3-phosphate dehydrogenase